MIKVWDYLSEYAEEHDEWHQAINDVLCSGKLILGPFVERFEQAFADYCGVRYGVGVNSGTDALFLALKALGIGHGDEVITVANTAVPTVAAIVASGARPCFVDIDPDTFLMDTQQLEQCINNRTKCILPVHLYGQCVDMQAVQAIADRHGIAVLEDCAQAHGATYGDKRAGAMSQLSAFSFYPTKILGGVGDAGMVLTNDESLYLKLKRLRFYGMETTYFAKEHGYNSRLDELHAAILLKKLHRLDSYIARRRQLAGRYDEALRGSALQLPLQHDNGVHAYYLYVCRHRLRDQWIERLKSHDIHVNISYPWPIHTMPAYQELGYKKGDLPHTERAADEIFSLPMYPSLHDEQQRQVIDVLLAIDHQLSTVANERISP